MTSPPTARYDGRNAMTVDVEEHFQVSAFEGVIDRSRWDAMQSRVQRNTDRLLELFDRSGVRGTFFILGCVAERHRELVRRIVAGGHEIASHGYSHRLIHEQDPEEFRDETRRSRSLLQDISGQPVLGYRAASFSITRRSLWALDILAEEGFQYDSSVFPVVHDRYGLPGALRVPHRLRCPGGATLMEVPPSTLAVGPLTLPVGGGGYLRLYPLRITEWAIRRLNVRDAAPGVVYVHPWEVDPEQPRVRAPLRSRFRHYTNLRTTAAKLERLVSGFRFGTMSDLLDDSGLRDAGAAASPVPAGP